MGQQNPELVQYFKGHSGPITSLCFSPSGKNLASSSEDNSFLVWNLTSNTASLRYKAKPIPVNYVTYSPTGTHIASAQGDFVRIWVSSIQGKSIEYKPHLGTVRSVEFSSNGEKLITASNDKSIKLWVTSRRKFLSSMSGHTNWVRIARYSPDSSMVVSCSDDKSIRLWDPLTSKCIHTFNETRGMGRDVRFHPSGSCIGAAMNHNVVKLYDLRSLKLLQYYACHGAQVNSLAFHPTGNIMVTASDDSTIKVIDLLEGRVALTLEAHSKPVTSVDFSKSGEHFATASEDKNVYVWKSNFDIKAEPEKTKRAMRESIANNTHPQRPNIKVKASNLDLTSTGIEEVYSAKDYEDQMLTPVNTAANSSLSLSSQSKPSLNDEKENRSQFLSDTRVFKKPSEELFSLLDTLTHENERLRKRMESLEERILRLEGYLPKNLNPPTLEQEET